jgi:hypothetical protein
VIMIMTYNNPSRAKRPDGLSIVVAKRAKRPAMVVWCVIGKKPLFAKDTTRRRRFAGCRGACASPPLQLAN